MKLSIPNDISMVNICPTQRAATVLPVKGQGSCCFLSEARLATPVAKTV